nr:ribonuclease H-like domain-containing protein [Tanacetum cinerariifolium]
MMSLFKSDSKYSDMFSQFESGGANGNGGCGDEEEGADHQDDEDEDDDGDTYDYSPATSRRGKSSPMTSRRGNPGFVAGESTCSDVVSLMGYTFSLKVLMEKQTREPFPISDHRSTNVGDVIHLDVWGPYKNTSRDGFKYFLTIVDDVSRAIWQNGVAKRKHRHLFNVARSLLFQAGIPLYFWTKCVHTATYLINRLPSTVLKGKSPFEVLFGYEPSLNNLRCFGCLCFSTILNNSDKLSSRDEVVKHEEVNDVGSPSHSATLHDSLEFNNDNNIGISEDNTSNVIRRSQRNTVLPQKFQDYVVEGKVKYAFKDKNWQAAMNTEIEALYKNNTWTLTDLPAGRKPVGNKWVFKLKLKPNGEIERYKARLVAKGFGHKEGIDYEETFSPVVKIATVRCLVSLAVNKGWTLYQLEVNNAFLYGDLDEDVYMSLPEGPKSSYTILCSSRIKNKTQEAYLSHGKEIVVEEHKERRKRNRHHDRRINTTGDEKGTAAAISLNTQRRVEQRKEKEALLIRTVQEGYIIKVYVDNIVLTGNNIEEINRFKDFLKSKFLIKDLGKLKYFLGIEVVDTGTGFRVLLKSNRWRAKAKV